MVKTVHVDHPSKVMDFNELARNVPVMVMFYMPGCYHCDMMKPEWKKFETKMKERYNGDSTEPSPGLAMVNSNHMSGTTGSERVSGFPTVLLLEDGKVKSEYEGDRTADDLVRFTESNASKSPPVSISKTPESSEYITPGPGLSLSKKLSNSIKSLETGTRKRRRSSKKSSRRNKTGKKKRTSSRSRKSKSKSRSKIKGRRKQLSRKSSRKSNQRKTRRRTKQSKQRTSQRGDMSISPSQTTTRGLDQLFGEI